MADVSDTATATQETYFRVTDSISEETWYWLALGSIGVSALLKLMDKDHWSLFVGQWPPTFLLFGLYHRLLRPSSR
jgi:hypothetical protein